MLLTGFSLYKSNQILSVNQRIVFLYLRNRYRERYQFLGGILEVISRPFLLPAWPVISIFRPAFARSIKPLNGHRQVFHRRWFLLLEYDGQQRSYH